jgi:hypothetical protein
VIVAIHQPEHLPWLGFFAKMAAADLWISLDTVPFRKNYYQNRNRVLGPDGSPVWLTAPVRLEGHLESRITDVDIGADPRWRRKYLRSLEQRYSKHPHFEQLFPPVREAIEHGYTRIAELNHALIEALRALLGITTPWVRASELEAGGSRSELLAGLCVEVGADVYLSGPSGRDYLDPGPFRERGIEVRVHDYDHPGYPQLGTETFVSHLSAVDLLFNCGAAAGPVVRLGSRVTPFSQLRSSGPTLPSARTAEVRT